MRLRTFPATKDSFSPLAKPCSLGSLRIMLGLTSTRIFGLGSVMAGLSLSKQGGFSGLRATIPAGANGNAIGPFVVGQTIRVRTSVTNSHGTRNSGPRRLIIQAVEA